MLYHNGKIAKQVDWMLMFCILIIGSSDKEQINYTDTRIEDLVGFSAPIHIKSDETIQIYDIMRVFSGDGPARQFEAGQQRGGSYSCICGIKSADHCNFVRCYQMEEMTLDDRCKLAVSKNSIKKLKTGDLHPFQNLKKQDIIKELESRSIMNNQNVSKAELQDELSLILHGVCRPPALLLPNPLVTAEELNLGQYEILACEPLHDISNVIQNVIKELPFHTTDKTIQKELESFAARTIGEKNQLKGSDARLYVVQLAKFLSILHQSNKIDKNMMKLISSLVEITNICYSSAEKRSMRLILRLYNQCFIFSTLCRIIIGNPVKMTSRKFYGSHFHCLTTHAPEILRLFSLRSILTEQEERCFGDMRRICDSTSNRQPEHIVDNAILRFLSQHKLPSKADSFTRQDSTISKQAGLLPATPRSSFTSDFICKRPLLFQAHLKRISDFMVLGENVWWSWVNGDVVFHDGPTDLNERPEGPPIHHFRSTSMKNEQIYLFRAKPGRWSAV